MKYPALFLFLCLSMASLPGEVSDPWAQADAIVASIQEPRIPDREFPVALAGDGETDDLPALQAAVDQCSREGGGVIRLGEGTFYLRGPLVLKSGVRLHLAEGAHLKFSGIPEDFLPPVFTRWEGVEIYNYSPMIYARHARDIAITGPGVVDGNAKDTFATWRPKQKPKQQETRERGDSGFPVFKRVYGEGDFLRPSLVQFIACNRVLIDGPTFNDSPFWIIHPVYCEDVIVRNATIDSHRLNNDGVDPDSCNRVLIENCVFDTGDDAVAIKAGRDGDARDRGVLCENIVIRNNELLDVHNAIAIGSEMSGAVRNVFIENNRVRSARNLLYFKSNLDRGGFIENVFVRDFEAGTATYALIRFQTNYHSHRGGHHPPVFRNFRIDDVSAERSTKYGVIIEGHEDAPITGVVLNNVSIDEASIPVHVNPWDQVTFENVVINGETRKPVTLPADQLEPVGY